MVQDCLKAHETRAPWHPLELGVPQWSPGWDPPPAPDSTNSRRLLLPLHPGALHAPDQGNSTGVLLCNSQLMSKLLIKHIMESWAVQREATSSVTHQDKVKLTVSSSTHRHPGQNSQPSWSLFTRNHGIQTGKQTHEWLANPALLFRKKSQKITV